MLFYQEPEWSNGWTEELAVDNCTDALYSRESIVLCQDTAGVDLQATIDSCVRDIKVHIN